MESRLNFDISRQPDQYTCGPTALHGIYRFFGDDRSLESVIAETPTLDNGGTLAVFLGIHALRCGYEVTLYSWNLQVFDPTWFGRDPDAIVAGLEAQLKVKDGKRLQLASRAYLEFLGLGGKIRMEDLTGHLMRRYLKKDIPILSGLSSTYLFNEPREFGERSVPDPIRGHPQGHFVVLCGYDSAERRVMIADPLHPNPLARDRQQYQVDLDRVMNAILLGILTYDSTLLIVRPNRDQASTD